MLLWRGSLLMLIVGAIAFADAACGGSNGQSCAQGTERCPCYGNSTCNPGLTCASNTCVNLGGAGGGSGSGGGSGGSSRGGTGGTNTAGAGGTSTAGTGGTSTGGRGGTNAGGSGGGSCTANTSTDPMNCGTCGHVCKNAAPVFGAYCPSSGCCVSGSCGPSFSPCLTQADATTCASYCSSIGETCVQGGCVSGTTWLGWGSANACAVFHIPSEAISGGACTDPIQFNAAAMQVRCCCTDTH